jgi:solute carrier family 25 carnitine/acylcarnitine transporter 20/29
MYPNLAAALKGTIKNEGFFGLYAGASSPLALSMVFRGWLYTAFHVSKRIMPEGQHFAAGALTGLLASVVESPMLLLMNQAQARPGTSVLHIAKTIAQERGVRGMFQGLSATAIRNPFCNAMYLGTFQSLRDKYNMNAFLAGGIGGVMYWVIFYPLDVVRGCMHADNIDPSKRKYAGWADAVRKMWAENGWKRFYRGYSACLLRAVPANGTFFLMAEQMKAWLSK